MADLNEIEAYNYTEFVGSELFSFRAILPVPTSSFALDSFPPSSLNALERRAIPVQGRVKLTGQGRPP